MLYILLLIICNAIATVIYQYFVVKSLIKYYNKY